MPHHLTSGAQMVCGTAQFRVGLEPQVLFQLGDGFGQAAGDLRKRHAQVVVGLGARRHPGRYAPLRNRAKMRDRNVQRDGYDKNGQRDPRVGEGSFALALTPETG